mgnify:CR=1 FL=1
MDQQLIAALNELSQKAKEQKIYEDRIAKLEKKRSQTTFHAKSVHVEEKPAHQAQDILDRSFKKTESTIKANQRFFASYDDVPKQAYTMGIRTIMQARKVLVVVSGADKAEIVQKAFFGPVTPMVPASILQMHPDVTVVADEAALSMTNL